MGLQLKESHSSGTYAQIAIQKAQLLAQCLLILRGPEETSVRHGLEDVKFRRLSGAAQRAMHAYRIREEQICLLYTSPSPRD